MGSRVKEVRKYLGLTGEKFGEAIGLKRNSLSQIETGKNKVTEQTIKTICHVFNVNEKWLRTGEGEMFEPITEKELREHILNESANPGKDPKRSAFIKSIVELTDSELDAIYKFMESILVEFKKNTES